MDGVPAWLQWTRRLAAIAQTGLHYTKDVFDRERFEAIRLIAAEMLAEGSGREIQAAANLFAEDTGYVTPKIDVRGAIFRGNRILLVQEQWDRCWSMPGGFADIGDTPSAAVEREILEEAGIEAKALQLFAVLDRDKRGDVPAYAFHIYKLFFLCKETGGELNPGAEVIAADFFHLDHLPPLSRGRTLPWHIQLAVERRNHPELPTMFD